MHQLEIIIFVAMVLVSVSKASMFFSHLPVHEETYVRHIESRNRRDVTNADDVSLFPEYRSFMLKLEGKKVRIDLKLNKHQKDPVRVKTYKNGQFTEVDDDSVPRDYAFYQQIHPKSRAAVMVRCDKTQPRSCHIVGHIRIEEKEYKIEPKTNVATLVSKVKHVIYRVDNKQKDQDYRGDTKSFNIDDSLIEHHTKVKRETRPKRQAATQNYKIELVLVADYHLYSFWLQREGGVQNAAIDRLRKYCELMVNDMDTRYATVTNATIDIIPLEIIVITSSSAVSWISSNVVTNGWIDASDALDGFQDWVDAATGLPDYDAIMALTSKDLASYDPTNSEYRNGTVGLAYRFSRSINGVSRPLSLPCRSLRTCSNCALRKYAVSIIEDLSGGDVAHSMAHELAHNLGVSHDSSSSAGCRFQDQYIMASGRYRSYLAQVDAGNQWAFSSCSSETIYSSLQDLLDDGETCLQDNSYNETDYQRIQNLAKSGETFTLNEQCELNIAESSYFCSSLTSDMSTICHTGVYCYLPWTTGTCRTMYVMDGTNCGSSSAENKVCQQGYCVNKSTTTTTTTTTQTETTTTSTPPTTTATASPPTTPTTTSTTTTTPTTTTTTPTTTTTTSTTTAPTTTTVAQTTTTPYCDVYCQICKILYQKYNGYQWYYCPSWVLAILTNQS